MSLSTFTLPVFLVLVLLEGFILLAFAATECPTDVSDSISTMIDDGELFSNCAKNDLGVLNNVDSLFDVQNFSERNFLTFCRSPGCIAPVKTLLKSTPADCFIRYHSLTRNMTEEVSMLLHKCAEVAGAADQTDEDYIYRYFLD
ncbi:hypothetical protein KRP22_006869 [Phytophthora ramorum]|nr:hypothetical protein KRP22_1999 [Phytophthora ramorum]